MSIRLAIIADDLTGALDTATPFAARGLRVAAALRPGALDAALASGADIVAINTASRALPATEAAVIVEAVAHRLIEAGPGIVMKKIDSRLKGNAGVEAAAIASTFALSDILVAPAVPDQGRQTRDGAVSGKGVDTPIPIAPHFPPHTLIHDALSDADLDRIAALGDWSKTLAVGARGLGAALARTMGNSGIARPFEPSLRTLLAIGSRDSITAAQIDAFGDMRGHSSIVDAPSGEVGFSPHILPVLLRCTGDYAILDAAVSQHFAASVVQWIEGLAPDTLVMSGGDTALAILDALGADLVFPQGEAAPGLPWFVIERKNRPPLRAVVKSGGFGDISALAALVPSQE
jgi:uncharacterized protein YgbK (DUF1537 family)